MAGSGFNKYGSETLRKKNIKVNDLGIIDSDPDWGLAAPIEIYENKVLPVVPYTKKAAYNFFKSCKFGKIS